MLACVYTSASVINAGDAGGSAPDTAQVREPGPSTWGGKIMWPRSRRISTARPEDMREVPCRDDLGRNRPLTVARCGDRVLLANSEGGRWLLTALQVGRLRAALRDLVIHDDQR